MDALAARYPFLESARAAVEAADVDIVDVISREHSPIITRAISRIEGAITEGRVPDPIRDSRVELLSYPVARVLVSLVDDPALTDRYALAEARRAFDLYNADREVASDMRSNRGNRLSQTQLLSEFDLATAITEQEEGFAMAVPSYLKLASQLRDRRWRLINRHVANGNVPLAQAELDELLREAIRERIAEDLPLQVPDAIAESLTPHANRIEELLADVVIPTDIDRVVPEAFPPCLTELIAHMQADDEQAELPSFVVVAFLSAIGLSPQHVVDYLAPDSPTRAETLRYQAKHIHGGNSATAYPPPSCRTMESLGLCVDDPDRCLEAGHPLNGYRQRLEGYSESRDWREQSTSESA